MSKVACLIIGENIYNNSLFLQYITNHLQAKFSKIETFKFIQKNDKELLFVIEDISKICTNLIIISSCETFSLVGKILSTITEDTLILKNSMLIPSFVDKYLDNSYILTHKKCIINVLRVSEGQELPNILGEFKEHLLEINIIEKDATKYIEKIEELSKACNTKISISTLLSSWVYLRISLHEESKISNFVCEIEKLVSNSVLIKGSVAKYLIEKLAKKNEKIVCVESCSGGKLSSFFINQPNASKIIDGSLVTYSNESKISWLGVDEEVISTFGAISLACLKQMLQGSLKISNATYAIGITGVAGPSTTKSPVGTIFVGVMNKKGDFNIKEILLQGDREYICSQSVLCAISEFVCFQTVF